MAEKTHGAELAARACALSELVEYREGSVVSRTLVGKKAGTVTLFAFAAGEGLSEHSAPFDALVCALEGEAELRIGGQALRLRQGEATLMPAGVPHALRAPSAFKMMLVMIKS